MRDWRTALGSKKFKKPKKSKVPLGKRYPWQKLTDEQKNGFGIPDAAFLLMVRGVSHPLLEAETVDVLE